MSSNTTRRVFDFNTIKEYENFLKTWVQPGIFNYSALRVIERFSDEDGIVTEELMLVEDKNRLAQFMLHIVELKDQQTLRLTLREAHVLNLLDGHEHITTLFTIFRHRQYIGLLLPAYSPLRDRIEYRIENKDLSGQHASKLRLDKSMQILQKKKDYLCLFTPNAVAYVLHYLLDALNFLHSKSFVHTQICASNIFMDGGGQVKLGGFLHSKRIGSKVSNFTGDPNCYPPEAFDKSNPSLYIHPSFDYWSLGLLTLELITGKRESRSEDRCRRLSQRYISGERKPLTLGEFAPNTLTDGKTYNEHIDSFLEQLFTIDPLKRARNSPHQHPFVKQEIHTAEARNEWNIPVTSGSPYDGNRSLFQEMFNSQGSKPDFSQEFLSIILRAILLAEKDFYPIFKEVSDEKLYHNWVGIEASVAIPLDDSEWSRDVLNESRASVSKYFDEFEQSTPFAKTPTRPSRTSMSGEDFQVQSHHPGLEKDYQRHEMVFFLKKSWPEDQRKVFTALQFARWYHRGVIKFPDLVRVCDEIEDIVQDYIISKRRGGANPPESVYFASALRRLMLNPAEHQDRETRHLCHMYVDIALKPEMNAQKKKKLLKLLEGDTIEVPKGLSTLQAAVCFREVDARKFDAIEAKMLGQINVDRWELDENQRKIDATGPETRLYKLLYERRRNPNRQADVKEEDLANSAQARTAKLWGDYDRDYLYKACNWALDESTAQRLYGNPFEESLIGSSSITEEEDSNLLNLQLTRTRAKQEEDVILPMKRIEDVEARRAAIKNAEETLARIKEGNKEGSGNRLGDQLKRFETSFNISGFA